MIRIETHPVDNALFGQSKWWGQPDMPEELEYPEVTVVDEDGEEYQDPLTFICQIRLEEIATLDPEGLLPHEGMLFFFAALDYFLGDIDSPSYPGMGAWQEKYFKVLYSAKCENIHTHSIVYDDGTPVGLPGEAIRFAPCGKNDDGHRLLGEPYIEEVREEFPGMISLLQVEEEDRWGLTFHDCGVLNFLITPEALKAGRWEEVRAHLFSF